jgi:putative hydrolase of the HAD superfamily
MDCPPSHIRLLQALSGRRLALVTNFDHPRTVHRLLAREGIAACFQAIVVSGEIGWRKPRPEIFLAALKGLGVTPFECLYVGDDFEKDIRGASAVGMPAVWLNEHDEPLPVEGPFPLAIIRALPELAKILND